MQTGSFNLIEAGCSKMEEKRSCEKITFYDSDPDSASVCIGKYNKGLADSPLSSNTDVNNIVFEENRDVEETAQDIVTHSDWIHLKSRGLHFSKTRLSTALEQYYTTKVELKRACFHREMSEIEHKVNDVLRTVHSIEPNLRFQSMQPSCFYEIIGPNEIDVFLILDHAFDWDNYDIEEDSNLPNCVRIRQLEGHHNTSSSLAPNSTQSRGPLDKYFVKSESGCVFLSAKAIGRQFKDLVRRSFEFLPREWRDSLPECKLNSLVHQLVGTELQRDKSFQRYFSLKRVSIQDTKKHTVNLIPTIPCRTFWPRNSKWACAKSVAWPDHALLKYTMKQGVHLVARTTDRDTENTWRIKFFDAQRVLINCSTSHSQCRLKCLRIVKVLCEYQLRFSRNFLPVHLENMLLELTEDSPHDCDWSDDMLPVRFLEFLVKIYKSLTARICRHYFMPEINLLSDVPDRVISSLADGVIDILNNPIKHLL